MSMYHVRRSVVSLSEFESLWGLEICMLHIRRISLCGVNDLVVLLCVSERISDKRLILPHLTTELH